MNELTTFSNLEFGQIRIILISGEPWFVAKDICDILDHSNVSMAMSRLDDDEVTKFNLGGQSGETNIINESGLYSLVLGSRKPEAKQFKKWITSEVIPSIRKTGSYSRPMSEAEILHQVTGLLLKQAQEVEQFNGTVETLNTDIKDMREVIELDHIGWREDCTKLVKRIALKAGGFSKMRAVWTEVHRNVDSRLGANLQRRLDNKRMRMANEGISITARDNVSILDIIAEDKKLIDGTIHIIKMLAVKNGVRYTEDEMSN